MDIDILKEIKTGLWYIFASAPTKISAATEGDLLVAMILTSFVFFQAGFWFSTWICRSFSIFKQNKKLNISKYIWASIISLIFCVFIQITFQNIHFGFFLGFLISPLFFNYNFSQKKENILKLLGLTGISIGFIFGILLANIIVSKQKPIYFPALSSIGGFWGWIITFYITKGFFNLLNRYRYKKDLQQKKKASDSKFNKAQEPPLTKFDQVMSEQKRKAEPAELEEGNQQKRLIEIERKKQVERAMSKEGPVWGAQQHRERGDPQRKEEKTRLENEKQLKLAKEKQAEVVQKKKEELKKIEKENKLKTEKEEALKQKMRELLEPRELRIKVPRIITTIQDIHPEIVEPKPEKEKIPKRNISTIQEQQNWQEKIKSKHSKNQINPELKSDWSDFEKVFNSNKITKLYHFTDLENLRSIKKHGGLCSWYYSDQNGIDIIRPGGDSWSRNLDRKYDLQDFVRLSFTRKHPMLFIARKEGRIKNPVILEIKIDVAYLKNTQFANMNATKTGFQHGTTLADLNRIRFDLVKQRDQFSIAEEERKYYQAEVLVLEKIPLEYILNIDSV